MNDILSRAKKSFFKAVLSTASWAFNESYKGFIVFNSNQIKSVYNRGTFDPNNDNIYYQGVKASKLDVTTQTEPKLMRNEARLRASKLFDIVLRVSVTPALPAYTDVSAPVDESLINPLSTDSPITGSDVLATLDSMIASSDTGDITTGSMVDSEHDFSIMSNKITVNPFIGR